MRRKPLVLTDPEPVSHGRRGVRADAGDGGVLFELTDPQAADFIRGGAPTSSGAIVNMETALKVSTAWRCLHLISGVCGNLPLDLFATTQGEPGTPPTRLPAFGNPARSLLNRPNGWQTPAEFRKMLTAHAVMRGNGYGLKIMSRGRVLAIWPMLAGRVQVAQRSDMTLCYKYTRRDGSQIELEQADVLHLRGLSLDGVIGVGVLQYARESMGLSLQAERAGASLYKNGIVGGKVFSKAGTLGEEAFERLKSQLEEVHSGAENAHKNLILEDGLTSDGELMTAEDMQFLGTREFQRSDVAMFFGVPPHMAGIVDKTTSWGTGLEQQSTGFVQYTADDWFVMWEQSLKRDLLPATPATDDLYFRINRSALLRGDTKSRWAAHAIALQWGAMNPDEVRAVEDMNPRPGGSAFYLPPNTPGDTGQDRTTDDEITPAN